MQSNLFVGFMAGLGFGGWVYSRFQRSTGGNTAGSLTAAVICGLLACIVVTVGLGYIS